MTINEIGLWRFIDERIRYMGFTRDKVDIQAWTVDIMSYYQEIDLEQNTVVLVSPVIDIPYTAQLIITGGNNEIVTSKEDYEKLTYANFQFFEDLIKITVKNYGLNFVPFRLEFLKLIPRL